MEIKTALTFTARNQEFNAEAIKLSIEFDGHQRIAQLLLGYIYQRKSLQKDIRNLDVEYIFYAWYVELVVSKWFKNHISRHI